MNLRAFMSLLIAEAEIIAPDILDERGRPRGTAAEFMSEIGRRREKFLDAVDRYFALCLKVKADQDPSFFDERWENKGWDEGDYA